jgi:hypothetical protein
MATTFKFYKDAGLTQEFVPGTDFIGPVTAPPQDFVLYLGSTTASRKLEAASDPGVAQLTVSILDAVPASGLDANDVKLAETEGSGLDAAVAGDPLDLGTVINSGVGNQKEIHIRVLDPGGLLSDQNVSIQLNTALESVV